MNLLTSTSQIPSDNIALEESLLESGDDGISLLFWQSRRAVVLGKNQNPWREVNLPYCREHDIAIARRFTGGGCVYQDEGNLNYAVVMPREGYCMTRMLDGVAAAFQADGVHAIRFMENSLGVAGRKFSGHAFCYRRDRVLHHGTLLFNADLNHLRASLQPDAIDLSSYAVASRPASVCNLADHGMTLDRLRAVVIRGIEQVLGQQVSSERTVDRDFIHDLDGPKKFASIDWIWGQTPGFRVEGAIGGQSFAIKIRKMRIEAVEGLDAAPLVDCSLLDGSLDPALDRLDGAMQEACRQVLDPFRL